MRKLYQCDSIHLVIINFYNFCYSSGFKKRIKLVSKLLNTSTADECKGKNFTYKLFIVLCFAKATCWMCIHTQNICSFSTFVRENTKQNLVVSLSKLIINVNVIKKLNKNKYRVNCSYLSKARTSNNSVNFISMMIGRKNTMSCIINLPIRLCASTHKSLLFVCKITDFRLVIKNISV